MGAQAAALLAGGGPVGDVPPDAPVEGSLRLTAPEAYDLSRTARSSGGVGLGPSAWDGRRLHRVLDLPDGPLAVVVHPDLLVTWSRPTAHAAEVARQLRTVLGLDDDLAALHDATDRLPELAWVRPAGAGRLLRAPCAWEDLVAVLAATNGSYASARARMRALGAPVPTPARLIDRADLPGWGYRGPQLRAVARLVADGSVDPERWRDLSVPDDGVLAELRALPGVGPFSAAQLLPLLGLRPRPLVLDGWLRGQVGDASRFAPLGRWAGTGAWLAVTRRWAGCA